MADAPLPSRHARERGFSVRLKLTLSYAALVMVAGVLLLAVVAVFLLRYVPDESLYRLNGVESGAYAPNRSDLIRAFVPAALWAMIALLAVGVVGGWLLAGRMLRPLDAMARTARSVGDGDLDARIDLPGGDDEFGQLADVFDGMLDRIQSDVERERRFTANASHELRTPLSITRALLDVADADHDVDLSLLLARLRAANTRAIDLTEALLLLARLDARAPASAIVDLSLAAEGAVELMHDVAASHRVRLEVDCAPVAIRGDAGLLDQLALNLLQNAVVHNLAADGVAVIRTIATEDAGVLVVENTGDIVDPALLATLTEPFRRGAGRIREGGHSGSGLGLAIARSIVDALDGTLVLSARVGGGLSVEARFPRG